MLNLKVSAGTNDRKRINVHWFKVLPDFGNALLAAVLV